MRNIIKAIMAALVTAGCSSIDCPLNNMVYTRYQVRNALGVADTLRDTLTISTVRTDGIDSVLINRNTSTTGFTLPISYTNAEDIFFVERKGLAYSVIDTLRVGKTDVVHFESTDCAPSYFHTINSVETTRHGIDSVKIVNKTVNYDTQNINFNIFFKAGI